ncbi:uncharacterized protein DUF1444 [Brevibacillus brevis]|uniref:DUF1444 family protein n=2 Tax=Brevibacillus brevis TaxID=1393 RepID=UPI000E36CACC|nr:DUF1444 family protein [Brevibacillus brevis]RED36005.1 uncharacterized protein DUF1444 [Brevibacillus brevis]VEF88885.1 Uncharacterized protein conserved in bacteria [Brevibacillus brevis]
MNEGKRGMELDRQRRVSGQEHNIYPVLRHASMISKYPERWVVKEHTADTYVLYALDQGEGYALIEKRMLQEAGWTSEQLHSYAMENLRKLPFSIKSQEVGGQRIHFISPTDGYAASRILLDSFLEEMDQKKQGDSLGVAIPHQDVLIVADMAGEAGAHLLARLTYDFASKGQVPISVLPFYWEEGELTPFLVVTHDSGTKIERK